MKEQEPRPSGWRVVWEYASANRFLVGLLSLVFWVLVGGLLVAFRADRWAIGRGAFLATIAADFGSLCLLFAEVIACISRL